MTVIATDSTRFSAVVKHEYEPQLGYCRDVVTVNDAAQTLKVGTVLGKVTATGKYKVQDAAAADGSQNAAAVLIADSAGLSGDITLANATDTKVLVLTRGPVIVSKDALTMGAGTNLDAEKQAVYDALKALGILCESAA
jgi:hypothetical protein